jgi:hypothetical protein
MTKPLGTSMKRHREERSDAAIQKDRWHVDDSGLLRFARNDRNRIYRGKLFSALALSLMLGACGAGAPASPPSPAVKALPSAPPPPPMPGDRRVCTADVQECPGGGFVGRNPDKNCAFDACPAAKQ